jgi:hypothetical protein
MGSSEASVNSADQPGADHESHSLALTSVKERAGAQGQSYRGTRAFGPQWAMALAYSERDTPATDWASALIRSIEGSDSCAPPV